MEQITHMGEYALTPFGLYATKDDGHRRFTLHEDGKCCHRDCSFGSTILVLDTTYDVAACYFHQFDLANTNIMTWKPLDYVPQEGTMYVKALLMERMYNYNEYTVQCPTCGYNVYNEANSDVWYDEDFDHPRAECRKCTQRIHAYR